MVLNYSGSIDKPSTRVNLSTSLKNQIFIGITHLLCLYDVAELLLEGLEENQMATSERRVCDDAYDNIRWPARRMTNSSTPPFL